MVRATTGGVLRSYRNNLMNSFIASNKARDTVLTQRNFNSYAEDPASAAKAFRLRMSRLTTKSQYDICEDTYFKFQSGFSCLQTIDELIDTENGGNSLQTLKSTTLKMLNDPTGDARTQLSKILNVMSETIVQNMNQKYGDNFIFAGADGQNVPFEVKTENGQNKLYYRGVPVDAQIPDVWMNGDQKITLNADGQYDPNATTGNYLKMYNVKTMSVEEYRDLYTRPEVDDVQAKDKDGNLVFEADGTTPVMEKVEYNADGTKKADGGEGGYYKLENSVAGYKKGELIPSDEYFDALARSTNPPETLKNTSGGNLRVTEDGVPSTAAAGGDYYLVIDGDIKDQMITQEDYEAEKLNAEKLEYLLNEKRFVDIGLGFKENENGELIESSAFNEILNGLTFLGHGLDQDGDPKNIYSIVQKLTELADSVPDGEDWSEELYDEFDRLVGKLEDASSEYKTQFANMDAGTVKLKNNLDLLEDNFYNLDEQTANLEDVDMAEAITSFIWAEYCYNAALKVGNSILSQSLMDYLQ